MKGKKGEARELKAKIYYPRTYRHLILDRLRQLLFVLACVLPVIVLLLVFYPQLTGALSSAVAGFLSTIFPGANFSVISDEFIPMLGPIYFIRMPSVAPSLFFSLCNLAVALVLLTVCVTGRRKGTPISIYFVIALLLHIVSSLYFAFASAYFPYTATDYTELYIKQQMSIWLCITVIAGFATGFISGGALYIRIGYYLLTLAYSFVFGSVRYFSFLFIIYTCSSLFMATLFFSLGPFFDFLYLVYFYGLFVDRMVTHLNSERRQALWQWF